MYKTLQLMGFILLLGILLSCSINESTQSEEEIPATLSSIPEEVIPSTAIFKEMLKDTVFPPDLTSQ